MTSTTERGSETSKVHTGDSTKEELRKLCAAYLAADQWGRDHTMNTALRQAEQHPTRSADKLHLVASARLDQNPHLIDDVINGFPLALVRRPVDD